MWVTDLIVVLLKWARYQGQGIHLWTTAVFSITKCAFSIIMTASQFFIKAFEGKGPWVIILFVISVMLGIFGRSIREFMNTHFTAVINDLATRTSIPRVNMIAVTTAAVRVIKQVMVRKILIKTVSFLLMSQMVSRSAITLVKSNSFDQFLEEWFAFCTVSKTALP